jgi:hypothetical protein
MPTNDTTTAGDFSQLLVTPIELLELLGLIEPGDYPNPEEEQRVAQVCQAADAAVRNVLDPAKGPHDDHANDREAAAAVAVQVWQSKQAPGGQMNGLDYAPVISPHLLGPGLLARVQGLLRPCRAFGGQGVVA